MIFEKRCDCCEFFVKWTDNVTGECRRFPPKRDEKDTLASFSHPPVVYLAFWCGEFKEKQ
jgi:hypothetical protein